MQQDRNKQKILELWTILEELKIPNQKDKKTFLRRFEQFNNYQLIIGVFGDVSKKYKKVLWE